MSNFIKLSVSKTATFQSCKAKYNFSYIQKLPRKEWEFHLFGRFVHRILELFHLEFINGSKESNNKVMSKSFNDALDEFKGKINQTAKDEAFAILKIYLSQLEAETSKHQILEVEKTFNLEINDDLVLTGMIDRVQLDDDGVFHVLDYKTSKSKTYLKDDLLQLLTYAYVIYKEHPEIKKVRVSYIMLRLNCEHITKEFELDEILSIKDTYENYANAIHKEESWQPNPTKLCAYCDYLNLCEAGLETVQGKFKTGKTQW